MAPKHPGYESVELAIQFGLASGIPANVVESNVAQGDVPEMEEEEEQSDLGI